MKVKNITKKYYSRLGFNGSIKEEDSDEQSPNGSVTFLKIEEEINGPNNRDLSYKKSGFLQENQLSKKSSFEMKKYLENEIEALLKVILFIAFKEEIKNR